MNVPVLVAVIEKWFGWPGMTSRLNRNSGTQNAWITSGEVRLKFDRLADRDLKQRQRALAPHVPVGGDSPAVVLYCG